MRFFVNLSIKPLTRQFCVWLGLLLLTPQLGWAVGTPSGTTISNQATATYVIAANPPSTAISNTVSFLVDKKVNLVVAEVGGSPTLSNSGQLGAATSFTVTNLGNDAQGYNLFATCALGNPAIGGIAPFTTNDFCAVNLQVFVDNGDNIFDPIVDTVTSIPSLAADASQTVFVVGDIPGSAVVNQQSVVSLTATAVAPATMAALVATVGGNTAGIDVIFADSAGVAVGDIPGDARHSSYDAYLVSIVNLTLTKSVISVLDPSGGAVVMPGSVMTYQIAVALSGSGTAANLVVADPLAAETSFVPGSISVNGVAKTDAADADNAQFIANTITVTLGNVAAPANIFITFRATIN